VGLRSTGSTVPRTASATTSDIAETCGCRLPPAGHSHMRDEQIEALQRMSIFGGIRDDILRLILNVAPVVLVPQGDYFFREGDTADSMFVLEAGKAAVYKRLGGQECLLRNLNQGDCFGEMSLIDFSPRSASVRAVEDCTALQISAACISQVYEKDLEQFAMIEMNMGREVSRRLRESDAALDPTRLSDGSGST
jgi:CRP/FNR family cyclic AMP-dependent transcriptional regulator